MRNAPEQRTAWATYIKNLLRATGLTGPKLAARLKVNPATVWRWETGKQKPEDPAVPNALAEMFGLDLDEVLAAAGLRPDAEPPQQPTQLDEETEMILAADIDEETRREALEQLHRWRLRDKARRMEDMEYLLRRRRR